MLQEALEDQIAEINNYIENPLYQAVYRGETLAEIKKLRTNMKSVLARVKKEAEEFEAKDKAKKAKS